jgi:hypothetical protein
LTTTTDILIEGIGMNDQAAVVTGKVELVKIGD